MSEINSIFEHVYKNCTARGKKLTSKRKLVLKALLHTNKALSAYELVDYCKNNFSETIQVMTMYRVLDFLESENFAHKLKVVNKYIVCSDILSDQDHGISQFLICSKCDKITEQTIEPTIITGLQSHAKQKGFTVTKSQLEINGVCYECVN
jgi:Fur family zinc uptake transcriptional regulator